MAEKNNAQFIHKKFSMKRFLILAFLILNLTIFMDQSFLTQTLKAENYNQKDEKQIKADKKNEKFLNEMEKLINAALESGFSEKEVREITIVRKGKVLYVWDFLEQEKLRKKKEALNKKKSKRLERYLTVMDIANELESLETKNLDTLKDNSIFVGAEQK